MTGAEGKADLHKRALAITCIIIISQLKVERGGRELFKSLISNLQTNCLRMAAWNGKWDLDHKKYLKLWS